MFDVSLFVVHVVVQLNDVAVTTVIVVNSHVIAVAVEHSVEEIVRHCVDVDDEHVVLVEVT